jgi:peptide/nickel transport system substrate-binding protein
MAGMRIGRVVASTAILAVLAGCTSGSTQPRPDTAPSTATTMRGPVFHHPGPGARPGGTLRVVSDSGPGYLDPNLGAYWLDYSLLRTFSRQLYSWPGDGKDASRVVPDLADASPVVDDSDTVYSLTIRRGARWNTSPPRQVTAKDVVRGVAMSCNPAQPAIALQDYVDLIAGMHDFCADFQQVAPRPAPMRRFLARNRLTGVHPGATPRQVQFELVRPANYFPELLALPALSPRPVELMAYQPGSDAAVKNAVSDGPYQVASFATEHYASAKSERRPGRLVLVRNPTWRPSSDPVRKAFADRILVTFRSQVRAAQHAALREVRSGEADICLCQVATADARRLLAAGDRRLTIHSTQAISTIVFNTASPNNRGALQNPEIRRAIAFALDRSALIEAHGGSKLAQPLTHVLPDGVLGSTQFDPYPHDLGHARAILRDAGHPQLQLRVYFPPYSEEATELFRITRRQLRQVGVEAQRFYVDERWPRSLSEPREARRGTWDLFFGGMPPDWPHNASASFFRTLFDGRGVGDDPDRLPPWSANFGLYDNPEVDRLIDDAAGADVTAAVALWHRADELVMQDAPFYPIAERRVATYRGGRIRNAVFVPALLGMDLTNVWLHQSGRSSL